MGWVPLTSDLFILWICPAKWMYCYLYIVKWMKWFCQNHMETEASFKYVSSSWDWCTFVAHHVMCKNTETEREWYASDLARVVFVSCATTDIKPVSWNSPFKPTILSSLSWCHDTSLTCVRTQWCIAEPPLFGTSKLQEVQQRINWCVVWPIRCNWNVKGGIVNWNTWQVPNVFMWLNT